MGLTTDSIIILNEYVIIPINVKKVKAIIKVQSTDIKAYNLFFGIIQMRQANCTQMFGTRKIIMKKNNKKI